jgi:pimeloyl-ACP methyl ester carboxylesterase
MEPHPTPGRTAGEGWVDVGGARLFHRVVGQGPPIIILHGGPDFDHRYLLPDFVPIECAANVASAIPDARLLVLEGCGHFAYLEAPEQTGSAIKAFLEAR